MNLSPPRLTVLISAAALASAAAIALAAPASADPGSTFTLKFRYDRAELATPERQKALLARLHTALRIRCNPEGDRSVIQTPESRACVAAGMRTALEHINSDELASIYDAAYGSRAG